MSEKEKKVIKLPTPEQRAKGVKLPSGNPLILAEKFDAEKLPENLRDLFTRIDGKGKDGIKLSTLCPKSSAGRYTRWLVRQLVKLDALKVVAEPKEPKPKTKAKKPTKSTPKKKDAPAKLPEAKPAEKPPQDKAA